MKILIFALIISLTCPSVYAGSSAGLITNPFSGSTSILNGFTAGIHQNKPACSTLGDDWAFNATTPEGKAMLALLLTAYSLKKPIHVEGKGVCDVYPYRESVDYFYIIDQP